MWSVEDSEERHARTDLLGALNHFRVAMRQASRGIPGAMATSWRAGSAVDRFHAFVMSNIHSFA